jgi:gluconolactonase
MRRHFLKSRLLSSLTVALLLLQTGLLAADEKIAGIGPTGEIKKLHTKFVFTEGPAAVGEDLYFSDVRAAIVYKIDAEGKLSKFKENSNKANGLMRFGDELYACQGGGKIVAWKLDGKGERVITDTYNDKQYNSPNDLVVDKTGGVYFTDPFFGRAPAVAPQDKPSVYYADKSGKTTRLIDDIKGPNGVILSPDEKTLYVVPSGQSEIMAYDVESPGKISKGRVFCTLKQPEGKKNTGGDGLTVDTKGNLYITSQLHVQVYDKDAKLLGIIKFPEQPANVTFGGKEGKTLYATARTSVYAVEMEATGHQFGGK